jgi:hypothetical protein
MNFGMKDGRVDQWRKSVSVGGQRGVSTGVVMFGSALKKQLRGSPHIFRNSYIRCRPIRSAREKRSNDAKGKCQPW